MRDLLKKLAYRLFLLGEKAKLHVLPVHYYSPVVSRGWLRRNPELWRRRYEFDWDLDAQLAWLRDACEEHLDEVAGFSFVEAAAARGIRFRYGLVEGQVLHCLVRSARPPRIVEVGSGISTFISSSAVARNVAEGGPETTITSIDPYMPAHLSSLPHVTVVDDPVQSVPLEIFTGLGPGDLVFLDSSHSVHAGSELYRLYLEILPSLPAGVIVHIHDIYLPWMFSPEVMDDFWDWQETALLAALMRGNRRIEPLAVLSALHDGGQEEMRAILPDYRPQPFDRGLRTGDGHFPSSAWLRIG